MFRLKTLFSFGAGGLVAVLGSTGGGSFCAGTCCSGGGAGPVKTGGGGFSVTGGPAGAGKVSSCGGSEERSKGGGGFLVACLGGFLYCVAFIFPKKRGSWYGWLAGGALTGFTGGCSSSSGGALTGSASTEVDTLGSDCSKS